MCLKHVLRKVQSNGANLFHGRLLEWPATPPPWHIDAVGGVHPINLGSHKGKALRRAIRSVGARLFFLPKYSPDLNPIEQLFAKLKHSLRKAAGRTADAICHAAGQALDAISAIECRNYFVNAGYEPT